MPGVQVPGVSPQLAVEGSYTIVDVRSPGEFASGSIPGSLNVPLLEDDERALVGTAFAERGAQEARLVAMDLLSPRLSDLLRRLKSVNGGGKRLAVVCARGGERSRNTILLLTLVGVHAVQVTGGYRAYRRWVLDGLADWRPDRPVFTLYGYTGSGKSELLRRLARLAADLAPRPAVVDLEELALHRGSLLGGLNQPETRTQKDFDALVWDSLRGLDGDYLVLEGEGAKIGRLFLPESVVRVVRTGRPVHVCGTVGQRVRRIIEEYRPDTWGGPDRSRFEGAFRLIGPRLERETRTRIERAFAAGEFGEVVRELLEGYYDPMYQRSSVEGRDFVLSLETGDDPERDVRTLADRLGQLASSSAESVDAVRSNGCVAPAEEFEDTMISRGRTACSR